MPRFRKRPVVIDAVQWTGENLDQVKMFAGRHVEMGRHLDPPRSTDNRLRVYTLEGMVMAQVGDWIIKGVKGEFYPCRADIFAATYDQIGGDSETKIIFDQMIPSAQSETLD